MAPSLNQTMDQKLGMLFYILSIDTSLLPHTKIFQLSETITLTVTDYGLLVWFVD